MKKILLLAALPLLMLSCKKETETKCDDIPPSTVAPDAEVSALTGYISSQGLTSSVTKHPQGFYYKIDTEGSGISPTTCSTITFTYQGKLTNGTTFDESSSPVSYTLGGLIKGWQLGLRFIKKGGSMKLYLPPSLAYGNTAQPGIPAGSILIFEVQLTDVQNN